MFFFSGIVQANTNNGNNLCSGSCGGCCYCCSNNICNSNNNNKNKNACESNGEFTYVYTSFVTFSFYRKKKD